MQLFENLVTHSQAVHDGGLDLRELDGADLAVSAFVSALLIHRRLVKGNGALRALVAFGAASRSFAIMSPDTFFVSMLSTLGS